MARTKKETHRTTQKHVANQDATDIQKKTILCVLDFPFLYARLKNMTYYGNTCGGRRS